MKKIIYSLALFIASTGSSYAQNTEIMTLDGAVGPLYVELQKPAVSDSAKIPLVIICHGFSGNSESPLLKGISDKLQEQGIASVRFDFNGHGKSGGEFKNMTVPNEIEDLKHVIDWAEQQPWVKNISLAGHSQGGVVASMTAGELGDKNIKSVVLMAPAAVLRDDALRGNTMGAVYDPWNIEGDYVQLPFGDLKLGKNYIESAVNLPIYETSRNYEGPVLVIHGTHDRVVPYTYGERYNHEYKNSELILIPGDDHGFSQNLFDAVSYASDWLINQLNQ